MSRVRKVFVWVFSACMVGMCLRVAIGDLYYMSDHRTFVCNEFPCFQKGYGVPYTTKDGREVMRYYCADHPAPESKYVSSRDVFFERPNLAGTILFVGFPCFLVYLWVKKGKPKPP